MTTPSPTRRTSRLLAGAAKIDITPPLEVGILLSSAQRQWAPFQFVREPLLARVLLLEQNNQRVAIISLDLLGLAKRAVGSWPKFLAAIAARAPLAPRDLIITSTHTHNGPETLDLTDLHRTPAFQKWMRELPQKIAAAITAAEKNLRPCTLAWSTAITDLTLHRRILTTRGIELPNTPLDPKTVLRRGGPKDETVRILTLRDAGHKTLATLVNATCHPVHEMCLPHISPDYPGELCRRIERKLPGSICLFLNGAAGNINPKRVSDGPNGSIAHGRKLAQAVLQATQKITPIAPAAPLRLARSNLQLPSRTRSGKLSPRTLALELTALQLGPLALLFLPGEPFVETGLALLAGSPFPFTMLAGYAAEWIGYLPTRQAFAEGGYETGPGDWSRLQPGAAERVTTRAARLLAKLATRT